MSREFGTDGSYRKVDGAEDDEEAVVRAPEAVDEDDDDDDDMMSDFDDDDDLDYLDSDSEEELDEEGKKVKKEPLQFGEWKQNLKQQSMNQETIPEDELHIVKWSVVILNFVLNSLTCAAFIGFVFVSQVGAVISLPLFLVTFFASVILFEYAQSLKLQYKIVVTVILGSIVGAGVYFLGPFEFLQNLSVWAPVPLLLVIVVLYFAETPIQLLDGGHLNGSYLWQCLSGKMHVVLWEEIELAALAKSLSHMSQPKTWCARRCSRFLGQYGVSESTMSVGLVNVDESQDIPDMPLSIDGEEIPPNVYVLTNLRHLPNYENTPKVIDPVPIKEFQNMLAKRKYISDKMLDSMINPDRKQPQAAPGQTADSSEKTQAAAASTDKPPEKTEKTEKKEKASKPGGEMVVREWVGKTQLPPRGSSVVIATLARTDPWAGIFAHWAPRAASITIYCALLALPTIHIFFDIDRQRRQVCDVGGPHHLDPPGLQYIEHDVICNGDLREGPDSCIAICRSLLSFLGAVHDHWHTSYVELLITFVLLPVSIFTAGVRQARTQHTNEVLIYLRRMHQPKNAVYEVMKIKDTFEDIFKPSFLLSRFVAAYKAWVGADDSLQTCGMITNEEFDLTATKGVNDCFRQVMEPVSALKSALTCEKTDLLPYGIGCQVIEDKPPEGGYPDIFDDPDVAEEAAIVKDAWELLKFRNDLGGDSGRNYKVLIDLQIMTEDAWNLFLKWLKTEYKEQLEFITRKDRLDIDSQDLGYGTHLKESVPIYDILMPKGFSLSHIYVQSMPEDGKPYQIEVRAYQKGIDRFWEHCDQLISLIKHAKVEDEDDYDEDTSILDYRLEKNPINARFALSEQFYNSMTLVDIKNLCPEFADFTINRPEFTQFVDACLKPTRYHVKKELLEDDKNYLFYSAISVFMGDENPLKAMWAAAKRCLHAISVYLECFALAMLIPVLRVLSGGQLFPKPFMWWMILNIISIGYQLVVFFSDFHVARTRLGVIVQCLDIFVQKTNKPSAVSDAEPKKKKKTAEDNKENKENKEGEDNQESQEEKRAAQVAKKKQELDTRPFDLVVAEVNKEYAPGDPFWSKEWRRKADNVQNWHMTVSYLRVFVSTSRLTAQTMLAAAVIVLGFLCLMSFVQAASGHGSGALSSMAQDFSRSHLGNAVDDGHAGARRLGGEIGEAMDVLVRERMNGMRRMSVEEAYNTDVDDRDSLEEAGHHLREMLSPVRAGLHGALLRQGAALDVGQRRLREARMSPGIGEMIHAAYRRLTDAGVDIEEARQKAAHMIQAMDLTKATKTQVFTIAMVVFMLLYSVPLMWNIVMINGHFDFHEDLLIKQQEQHRTAQNRREWKKVSGEKGSEQTAAESEPSDAAQQQPTETPDGGPATKAEIKDPDCSRYERVLAMAIKSSRKTRERFPLKLFGFVISFQLLATWIGLAAAPIVSEASKMAPPLTMAACGWLEHSRLASSIQKQIAETNPAMHVNVTTLIHDNLCIPLSALVQRSAASSTPMMTKSLGLVGAHAVAKATGIATPDTPSRRLLSAIAVQGSSDELGVEIAGEVSIPHLATLVQQWWRAHPQTYPEVKYATARLMLNDLGNEGDRLLDVAPAAVLADFDARRQDDDPEAPFWAALASLRPHIDAAMLEFGQDGPASESRSGDRVEL